MKKFFAVALCAALVAFGAQAEAAINLKLGHTVNEQDVFHTAAIEIQKIVDAETKGEVKISLFPNAKLGDERNLLESLKMGTVDMAIITGGPVINFLPEFGVLDLPFLFKSPEHAYKVLDGKVGQGFFAKMEKLGWKGLAYGERGFRNLSNNKHAVKTPADIKGLKIRLMQNPVYVDSFKALGANAVPMAWTETLTALQQGTIDGQENPVNVIYSYKIYDSNKYLTLTRHAYAPNVILMSMKAWKKLSPEQQKIVMTAAKKAAALNRRIDNENEAKWLKEIKEKGMIVEEKFDYDAFVKAVQPVYDKYGPQYGKDLIEAIRKEAPNK